MSNDDNRCTPILIKPWHSNIGDTLIYNFVSVSAFPAREQYTKLPFTMSRYYVTLSEPVFVCSTRSTAHNGLCPSSRLYVADFSYNFLVGKIPSCLKYLPRYYYVMYLLLFQYFIKFAHLKVLFAGQVSKGTASRMSTLSNNDLCKFVQVCIFFSTTQQSLSITQ